MVLFRWLIRFSLAVVGLLVLAAALAVFNNNVSLSGRSRVDFADTLDRSLAASAGWTVNQFSSNASGKLLATDLGVEFANNPALLHMLVDTSAISGDPRLRDLTSKIVVASRKSSAKFDRKIG